MDRELIDRAAASYADSIPQSDERKRYCREAFIAGARWVIELIYDRIFNGIKGRKNNS